MKCVKTLPMEERLLVLLNLARINSESSVEIRKQAASKSLNWETLFRLSESNAVGPLSLHRLKAEDCAQYIPTGLLARWEARVAPIVASNVKRTEWAERMLTAMHEGGVEVIVLKGSMFAETLYTNRSYKKMNDIDVMMRREDAERAIEILKENEFRGVGALFGKNELSSNSHHTPPYVSHDLGCVVGLHWGLVSPLSPWRPDTAGIWDRKVAVEVAHAPAFRMSWEDNLLHLCIHLPFFKTGLRELADVFNLVLFCEPGIDWDLFASRVKEWKAEDPVYRVLALANALVDLKIPRKYRDSWKASASRLCLSDTRQRLERPATLLESRSTQAAKIEKAYAVFTLTENYSEKLKAWAGMYAFLLWPKEAELYKISGSPEFAPDLRGRLKWASARLQAPSRLWQAMARDHGNLPLVAMMAMNLGILAREGAKKALHPTRVGRSLRNHPAAKLLEVLE